MRLRQVLTAAAAVAAFTAAWEAMATTAALEAAVSGPRASSRRGPRQYNIRSRGRTYIPAQVRVQGLVPGRGQGHIPVPVHILGQGPVLGHTQVHRQVRIQDLIIPVGDRTMKVMTGALAPGWPPLLPWVRWLGCCRPTCKPWSSTGRLIILMGPTTTRTVTMARIQATVLSTTPTSSLEKKSPPL